MIPLAPDMGANVQYSVFKGVFATLSIQNPSEFQDILKLTDGELT
jgi:hypothetical protein